MTTMTMTVVAVTQKQWVRGAETTTGTMMMEATTVATGTTMMETATVGKTTAPMTMTTTRRKWKDHVKICSNTMCLIALPMRPLSNEMRQ